MFLVKIANIAKIFCAKGNVWFGELEILQLRIKRVAEKNSDADLLGVKGGIFNLIIRCHITIEEKYNRSNQNNFRILRLI